MTTVKKFNFNLGNRGLTAEESAVVQNAKARLQASIERHGRAVAGGVISRIPSEKAEHAECLVMQINTITKYIVRGTAVIKDRPARGTDVVKGNAKPKARGTDAVDTGGSSWITNKVAPPNRRY